MENETFIKNTIEVVVDSIRQENRYIITAMYDIVDEEGYGELDQRVVEDLTLTWEEIKKEGGISEINKQFKEAYNL